MNISTVISVVGILSSPLKYLLDKYNSSLKGAYDKALKRWTRNDSIRDLYAEKYYSNLEKLIQHIKSLGETETDKETYDLLVLWEEELCADYKTYHLINRIVTAENLKIGIENKSINKEISQKLVSVEHKLDNSHKELKEFMEKTLLSLQSISALTPVFPEIKKFNKPDLYIPRKIRAYYTFNFSDYYRNKEKYEYFSLMECLLQKSSGKIQLFSDAQSGKSTEMENIAYELQESKLFRPFLFYLKNYHSNSLNEQYGLKNLLRNKKDKIILLFDGLDEIGEEKRRFVIKEIAEYAYNYPQLYIIVSCRKNYEGTNYIDGFYRAYLNDLLFGEVENYIRNLKLKDGNKLIKQIEEKQLYSLVANPFFLKTIIKYFEVNQDLPKTKGEIYNFIIENSFELDETRRLDKGKVISLKSMVLPLLEKIAFCIQLTDSQEITEINLITNLQFDYNEINLCCQSTIFERSNTGEYSFAHSAFREYLVANKLKSLQYDQLISIICYENSEKLKPSWYNVITILIGILEKSSSLYLLLVEWLSIKEQQLLIQSDKHMLTKSKCIDIFYSVFNHYKTEKLFIGIRESEELMKFANFSETILFLMEELKQEVTLRASSCNILCLLEYANYHQLTFTNQSEVFNAVLDFIKKNNEEKELSYYLMLPFENDFYLKKNKVKKIYETLKDTQNSRIINSFFEMMYKVDVCEEYFEWILNKGNCIQNYTGLSGAINVVKKDNLYKAISSVNTSSNIFKAYEYLLNHFLSFEDNNDTIIEVKKKLLNKLTQIKEDTRRQVTQLLVKEKLKQYHRGGEKDELPICFREYYIFKQIDEIVFQEYYKEIKDTFLIEAKTLHFHCNYFNVLAILLTDKRLDKILNDVDLPKEQRINILRYLQEYKIVNTNQEWVTIIEAEFKRLYPSFEDYKQKIQNGFDILFQHENFKKELQEVIQKCNATIINRKELEKEDINESILDFLYGSYDDKKKSFNFNKVLKKVESIEKFKYYVLNRITHYYNKKIKITEHQKEWVKQSIVNILENVEEYQGLDIIAQHILFFNLTIEEKLIVKLLKYGHYPIKRFWYSCGEVSYNRVIDLLKYRVENQSFVIDELERILTNTQFNPAAKRFYITLLEYIIEKKLIQFYSYFIRIFYDLNFENDIDFQKTIIFYLIRAGREGYEVINPIKSFFNIEVELFYYQTVLYENIFLDKDEKVQIKDRLEKLYIETDASNKNLLLELLLFIGSIKGLELYIQDIRNKDSIELKKRVYSLNEYTNEHIEQIIEVFKIALKEGRRSPSSIQERTAKKLEEFAMESVELRDKVITLFREIANSNDEYSYLNRIAIEVYNKYFEANSHKISYKKALELYNFLI